MLGDARLQASCFEASKAIGLARLRGQSDRRQAYLAPLFSHHQEISHIFLAVVVSVSIGQQLNDKQLAADIVGTGNSESRSSLAISLLSK